MNLETLYKDIFTCIDLLKQEQKTELADRLHYFMTQGCWNGFSELLEEVKNELFVFLNTGDNSGLSPAKSLATAIVGEIEKMLP